jgi:Spy/CpxP family protein refolding chaperone
MQIRLLTLLLLLVTQLAFAQEKMQVPIQESQVTEQRYVDMGNGPVSITPDGKLIETEIPTPLPEDGTINSFSPSPAFMFRIFQVMHEANREGKLLFGHLLEEEDEDGSLKELLGISEAQRLHFDTKMQAIEKRFDGDDFDKGPEDDSPDAFAGWEDKEIELYSQAFDEMDTVVRETLTPFQLQALREYDLVNPLDVEEIMLGVSTNFDAYEALDLSEEQREQLKEILEEEVAQSQKMFEEIEKTLSNPGENLEESGFLEKGKANAVKIREKIQKILTPQQRERLDQLKEEISKKLAQIKEKKASEPPKEDDSWKDAWKPGDPIPEEFQQPTPPIRFPRKKVEPPVGDLEDKPERED